MGEQRGKGKKERIKSAICQNDRKIRRSKGVHALVPLVDGVLVDEGRFYLDGAQETKVVDGAVVDIERNRRLFRRNVAEGMVIVR